jgi:hypothetical protein
MKTYYATSFSETLSFAESLGWIDTFPDASINESDWSPEIADAAEDDAIDFIKWEGFRIVYTYD